MITDKNEVFFRFFQVITLKLLLSGGNKNLVWEESTGGGFS